MDGYWAKATIKFASVRRRVRQVLEMRTQCGSKAYGNWLVQTVCPCFSQN
jgi:hypothetical protein